MEEVGADSTPFWILFANKNMKGKVLDTKKVKRATLSVDDDSVEDKKAKVHNNKPNDKKQAIRNDRYLHRQMGVSRKIFHRKIP